MLAFGPLSQYPISTQFNNTAPSNTLQNKTLSGLTRIQRTGGSQYIGAGLQNGDFTYALSGWNQDVPSFVSISADAHSGNSCVRIDTTSGSFGDIYIYDAAQPVGQLYAYSFWAKSKNGTNNTISGTYNFPGHSNIPTIWTKYSGVYNTNYAISFLLRAETTAAADTIWIDDIEVWKVGQSLSGVAHVVLALPATDNFNRASQTPLAGNWTSWGTYYWYLFNGGGDASLSATGTGYEWAHWNASLFDNDQYAKAKVANTNVNDKVGVGVRMSNGNGYFAMAGPTGSSGSLFGKIVGNTVTVQSTNAAIFANTGDVIKIIAAGTNILWYINDVLQENYTDSSLTSGNAGIAGYNNAGSGEVDDFEGGNWDGVYLNDGFESGTVTANWSTSSTPPTADTAVKNSGSYSAKFSFADWGGSGLIYNNWTTRNTDTYVRLYFRREVNGGTNNLVLFSDDSGNTCQVYLTSDNHVVFEQYAGGSYYQRCISTGTAALNTWYPLQIHFRKSTTDAIHEIKVFGETITDTTADDSTAGSTVYMIGHTIGGAQASTFYIDDIAVSGRQYPALLPSGNTTSHSDLLGRARIQKTVNPAPTIQGLSRIQKTNTGTLLGKTRIQTTTRGLVASNWITAQTGLPALSNNFTTYIGSRIWVGLGNGDVTSAVYYSDNDGVSWNATGSGLVGDIVQIVNKGSDLYACSRSGIFKSINNGVSWSTSLSTDITSLLVSGSSILATHYSGGVVRSDNDGSSWQDKNTGLIGSYFGYLYQFGSDIIAIRDNCIVKTSNLGDLWTNITGDLPVTGLNRIAVAGSTLFVAQWPGGVWKSTNGGTNWTQVLTGDYIGICYNGTHLIVGGWFSTIYYSVDLGTTWTNITSNISDMRVTNITTSPTVNGQFAIFPGGVAPFEKMTIGNMTGTARIQTAGKFHVTDDFNRADENPLAGNWAPANATGVKLVSNAVATINSSDTDDECSIYMGATFAADQYVRARIASLGNSNEFDLVLRARPFSYNNSRNLVGGCVTLDGTCTIWEQTDSGGDNLFVSSSGLFTLAVNDVIEMRVIGQTVTFYHNGILRGTATTARTETGYPGLGFFQCTGTLDNLEAGNLVAGQVITGKANISVSVSNTTATKTINATTRVQVTATPKTLAGVTRVQRTVTPAKTILGVTRAQKPGVLQIIVGKAAVKQLGVLKTIAGVLRTQRTVNPLPTISGVTRTQKNVVLQTLNAVAKIVVTANTVKTISAITRVQVTVTPAKTILGVLRTQKNSVLQTLSAVTRTQKNGVLQTLSGKADIKQLSVLQTISGKGNIKANTLRVLTGATRVQRTVNPLVTISGISRTQKNGVLQTINAVAKIAVTGSTVKTLAGISRIQKAGVLQTITGVTKIVVTSNTVKTLSGITRVQKAAVLQTIGAVTKVVVTSNALKTLTGVSRVQKTVTPVINGVLRTQHSVPVTLTGITRTQKSGILQTLNGVTRAQKSGVLQTITAIAKVVVTSNTLKTIAAVTRVQRSGVLQTLSAIAKIVVTVTASPKVLTGVTRTQKNGVLKTISAVTNVTVTGSTQRTINGVTRIQKAAVLQTLAASSRVQKLGVLQTLAGIGRVRKTVLQAINGTGNIKANTVKVLSGIADVKKLGVPQVLNGVTRVQKAAVLQTVSAVSRTQRSGVLQTIGSLARVQKAGVLQTVVAKATVRNTTLRVLSGIGNIKATTQKVISGVGRTQRAGMLQTIAGVLRTQKVGLLQTVSGISRIQKAVVLHTISAVANVVTTGNAQKVIIGKAAVQKNTVQTLTGILRTQKTGVLQTVIGKADVRKNALQTLAGIGNIKATSLQMISAKADVRRVGVLQTLSGLGRIQKTVTVTLSGVARIQKSVVTSLLGIARTQKTVLQTIAAKADVRNTTLQSIAAKGNIKANTLKVISAIGRIQKPGVLQTIASVSRVQKAGVLQVVTGVTRIQKSGVLKTLTAVANIAVTGTAQRTINGKAAIQNNSVRIISGVLRTQRNVLKTLTGIGRVQKTAVLQTISSIARIQKAGVLQTLSGILSVRQVGVLRTLTGVGSIKKNTLQTISAKVNVKNTSLQVITGKGSVKKTALQVITGKTAVKVMTLQVISGTGRVQRNVLQTIGAQSRVQRNVVAALLGIARVRQTVLQTILAKANVRASTLRVLTGITYIAVTGSSTRTLTGKAAVQKNALRVLNGVTKVVVTVNTQKTLTAVTRVQVSTSRTVAGIASVRKLGVLRTLSGMSRVQLTAPLRTLTGITRIQLSSVRTLTGISRVRVNTLQSASGIARVQVNSTRVLSGITQVRRSVTQALSGISRVRTNTLVSLTGIAQVRKTVLQTIVGRFITARTTLRMLTGVSDVRTNTSQVMSGAACIRLYTKFAWITGRACIAAAPVEEYLTVSIPVAPVIAVVAPVVVATEVDVPVVEAKKVTVFPPAVIKSAIPKALPVASKIRRI